MPGIESKVLIVTESIWKIWLVVMLTALVSACQLNPDSARDEGIWLNGRIEGDHVLAATRQPGQVVRLRAHEGDAVAAGQVLAELDDTTLRAKVTQAAAAWHAAQKQYEAARTGLEMLRRTLPLKVQTAEAGLRHARAAAQAATAQARQAERDWRRLKVLFDKGQISREQLEQARLALETARAQEKTAQAAMTQAEKALAEARVALDEIHTREAEVEALHAQTLRAHAALEEAMALLDQLKIRAPQAGVVVRRLAHVGEMLAPGAVLFDIVDLDRLYFQGYVPEADLGRIHLGQKGTLHVDGLAGTVRATLRYVSSEAEFTPKEIQTRDERVKQVFAVKFYLDENPDHRYKPGMPADLKLLP